MPESTGSGATTPRRSRQKSKKAKSRIKAEREVLVHGCLPPQVDGQIRCYVVVSLKKVTWKTSKYPVDVFLRCLWWGDSLESAAIFSPSENKVVARYPVRSGPKQMAAYLTDAGTLHVDVLRGGDMAVIGKVQIYGLSALATGKSLSGPYPIFSSKSEIIGHINVDVSMQALHTFEDSGSSILPTTDLDNTELIERLADEERVDAKLGTPSAYSSGLSHHMVEEIPYLSSTDHQVADISNTTPVAEEDLITNLLVKGEQLRNEMISSTIDRGLANHVFMHRAAESDEQILQNDGNPPDHISFRETRRHDREKATVNLVLGSSPGKAVYVSDSESMSSASVDLSDWEDPLHDQEILDLLFYKNSSRENNQGVQVDAATSMEPLSGKMPLPRVVESQHANVEGVVSAGAKEDTSIVDDVGNVRPPSRSSSTSPRILLNRSPSPLGNQSDSATSRVSFDMTSSDDEDTRSAAEGLSVEQLTLLARVSVARVHIGSMELKERPSTPVEKKVYKGRPPPAKTTKYGTYFIEYQFPVVAASRDQGERNTPATETVRAVSKKVEKSGVVTWNHHTVFPVFFDGQTVEKWWSSMLVFKVHHRIQTSRTASLIGSCSIPMKQLLQSLTFGLDLDLPITKLQRHSAGRTKRRRHRADMIGQMKVSIQLDSDSPSFATALRELQMSKARKQHPLLKPKPSTPVVAPSKPDYVKSDAPVRIRMDKQGSEKTARESSTDLMLHVLLSVSEGRQLLTEHQSLPIVRGGAISTYIICRIFWSTDKLRSEVCWSSRTPNYMINETLPLHVTKEVLSNMANNYMVLEVWEKRMEAQKDGLIGYAKLPLNTFYMSYKEPKITQVLLKSQYPVIAVDSFLPVVNPLTGKKRGEVKVLLAMGTQEQVMSLQTLKVIATVADLERQQLEQQVSQPIRSVAEKDTEPCLSDKNEHRFDLRLVAVRDLILDEGMYMGEADCFIQYHFPSQPGGTEGELTLKAFRSPTTLCTDAVTFNDFHSHHITLGGDKNLQASLISAFGQLHSAAIPLELWCRFYHPNTRDQLMAKSLLPLPKLLGLITMGNNSELQSSQSYSLPLVAAAERRSMGSVGVLDISISYTKSVLHLPAASVPTLHSLHTSGQVILSACIESITGLKSAALALSHRHQCLDYYSTVGVNLYVKTMLSFQPKSDIRVSKTEPRVFYLDDFGFKALFELPLMVDNQTSLAQCLHTGYFLIEVWHQSLKDSVLDDCPGVAPSTDILLGISSVPLTDLLFHKSGMKGWYPVNAPPELYTTTQSHDPMMGAIRVQLKLTGSQDMANIVDSASRMGYQLPSPGLDTTEAVMDEMTEVKIEVDWFSVPVWAILKTQEDHLPFGTACYIKTSFYNNDVVYSQALQLSDKGDNFECRCDVRLRYMQSASTSFLWYLFDQPLELELWLSKRLGTTEEEITPSSSDRYLGSAHIALTELSKRRRCTVNDVYPIYRLCSERMGRALVQVHLTRRPVEDVGIHEMKVTRKLKLDTSAACELNSSGSSDQSSEEESLDEDIIETMISVEEANRLSIGQSSGTMLHVSYSLADREHTTPSIPSSSKPCWMYEKCVRLHLPSIEKAKHLVLKLWCKTEDKGSQVLGFTTIDLRPLLAGMSHLSGWYNIVDFTGLCQGQIKCGIQPLKTLERRSVCVSTPPQHAVAKLSSSPTDQYFTQSGYPEFPSHISRFTEQRVHLNIPAATPSTSSELLRKQLSELDIMTSNLRKRLHGPSFYTNAEPNTRVETEHPSVPGSQLLSTVNKVHSNVLELVERGVISTSQMLPSSLLQASHGTGDQSLELVTANSLPPTGTKTDEVAHEPLQHSESVSVSPFTSRTPATYSNTSDDEQFSPPIFTRNIGDKAAVSEEMCESSDWASDGVKHLSDTESSPPSTRQFSHGELNGDIMGTVTKDEEAPGIRGEPGSIEATGFGSATHPSRLKVDINASVLSEGPSQVPSLIPSEPCLNNLTNRAPIETTKLQNVEEEDMTSQSTIGSMSAKLISLDTVEDKPAYESTDKSSVEYSWKTSESGTRITSDDVEIQGQNRTDDMQEWSEGDTDYEEEEAVSRTINEDVFPSGDHGEDSLGAFHDGAQGFAENTLGSAEVMEEDQRLLPSVGNTPSHTPIDSDYHDAVSPDLHHAVTDMSVKPPVTLSSALVPSQLTRHGVHEECSFPTSSSTATEYGHRPPLNRPLAHTHARVSMAPSDNVEVNDQEPVNLSDKAACGTGGLPSEHDAGPAENDAGLSEHDAGPAENDAGPAEHDAGPAENDAGLAASAPSLPLFFPSKEELAAKLNAAKLQSNTQDRFALSKRRISEIAREQCDKPGRTKRVADIFSSRFT